eukprot:c12330_g1_i1 orf=45-461(-)
MKLHAEVSRQDLASHVYVVSTLLIIYGNYGAIVEAEVALLNVFVGSILVSMYAKQGPISDAEQVLADMPQRNVASWNAMLSTYVDRGAGKKALHLYHQMQQEEVTPDHLTYVMAFQACCTLTENKEAQDWKGLTYRHW